MTPVYQDKFAHNFKHGGGNCLQACVASLLDLPLEAVPHFMVFGEMYWAAFCLYMKSAGFEVMGYVDGSPPLDDRFYITSIEVGKAEFTHAVITKNRILVHDPHPRKSTAIEIVGYYQIEKV